MAAQLRGATGVCAPSRQRACPAGAVRARAAGDSTIRPFEALACGIPLVSAPWTDSEGLFTAGLDYLVAADRQEMVRHLRDLLNDEAYGREIAAHGRRTVLACHTCAHRVDELLAIYETLRPAASGSFDRMVIA
jgi:spore maturation protein CgeB